MSHQLLVMQIRRLFLFALIALAASERALALDVGQAAPDFTLTTYEGQQVKLSDYRGKIIVLEWFNTGCPFVGKHYRTNHMPGLHDQYVKKGVIWMMINSTYEGHENFLDRTEADAFLKDHHLSNALAMPDKDGRVGKMYGAKTTPQMFIIDESGRIAYEGAIDDNPDPDADPGKANNYVQMALDDLVIGKPIAVTKTASYGCSVKYRG